MKFKIKCKSPLLQKTLEYFLKDYLSENGVLISDDINENGIIIGKDIKKPFSKSNLLIQLENLNSSQTFEEKLHQLIQEFEKKLNILIKEHYGKK